MSERVIGSEEVQERARWSHGASEMWSSRGSKACASPSRGGRVAQAAGAVRRSSHAVRCRGDGVYAVFLHARLGDKAALQWQMQNDT